MGWIILTKEGKRTKQSGDGLTIQLGPLGLGEYQVVVSAFDAFGHASSSTNKLVVAANEAAAAAARVSASGPAALKLPSASIKPGATLKLDAATLQGVPRPAGARGSYTYKWVVAPVSGAATSERSSTVYGPKLTRTFTKPGSYRISLTSTDSKSKKSGTASAVLTVAAATARPSGTSTACLAGKDKTPPKVVGLPACLVGAASKWHCFGVDALVRAQDNCAGLSFSIKCATGAGGDCAVTKAGKACVRASPSSAAAGAVGFVVAVRDAAANTAAPITVPVKVYRTKPQGRNCPTAKLAKAP